MNIRISIFGLIILLAFVLADESSSHVRIKNNSSNAHIIGLLRTVNDSQETDDDSFTLITGQVAPGQSGNITVPSSKKKYKLSVNYYDEFPVTRPFFLVELAGPFTKCYVVMGAIKKLTWKEESCS